MRHAISLNRFVDIYLLSETQAYVRARSMSLSAHSTSHHRGHSDLRTPSPPPQQDDTDNATGSSVRSGGTWLTPSHRSNTPSISSSLRVALSDLCKSLYGEDSIRCLLTGGTIGLNVVHVIRHATKSPEVRMFQLRRII